ncbi:hypothetical protein AX16_010064 [Volvariella volvacea WC 439]|nr:hypothetical protein AX16_010064 [Volvariella volvacea WC 439]
MFSARLGLLTLTLASIISLFAASSSAAAIFVPRNETPSRRDPPTGGTYVNELPYRFTFAAVNVTFTPGANSTGAPLVLGQNGASGGIRFYVTSTYYTFPWNDYPSISLTESQLKAHRSDGSTMTNSTMSTTWNPVTGVTRTSLYWWSSGIYTGPGDSVFSALLPDSTSSGSYPLLAVYGDADSWSLCLGTGTRPQTNLYYNVAASDDCYRVRVNILPFESDI